MQDQPSETPAKRPELNQQGRQVVLASIALVLLALVAWALQVAAANERRALMRRSGDALAAALATPVLELRSQRFANRDARLQQIVEAVARAGEYDRVYVTNAAGEVLASTDATLSGQTVKPPIGDPQKAAVADREGLMQVTAPIFATGGQRLGYLYVRTR